MAEAALSHLVQVTDEDNVTHASKTDSGTRVLVTGGAGFVGIPVIDKLLAGGNRVAVLDNFSTAPPDRLKRFEPYVDVINADLRDGREVMDVLMGWHPQVCLHLAALHFIPDCEARPAAALDINVLGTQHLLDALTVLPVPCKLLFVSTADVYRPSPRRHRESSAVRPDNIYGLSKMVGEQLVEQFAKRTGSSTSTVRLFNVYGPGDNNPHVIPHILGQLRHGDSIELGNTSAKRDFIYVDDVAETLVRLSMTLPPGLVVNLGTGRSYSVDWVVKEFERLLGRAIHVRRDPSRLRSSDRPDLRADVTTLKRYWPSFDPMDMSEGLARLLRSEGLLMETSDVPAS